MRMDFFFIVLAYLGRSLGPTYLLMVLVALSFTGLGLLYYRKPRRTMVIAKSLNGATELKTTSKVVTLTHEASVADKN